ncbi:MAG: hypothetical protein WD771_00080 [Gemmatimonadaceae bacterium]
MRGLLRTTIGMVAVLGVASVTLAAAWSSCSPEMPAVTATTEHPECTDHGVPRPSQGDDHDCLMFAHCASSPVVTSSVLAVAFAPASERPMATNDAVPAATVAAPDLPPPRA